MAPIVMEFSVSPFSISITWTSSGAVVDSYEVLWDRATPDDCPNEHTGSATISGTLPVAMTSRACLVIVLTRLESMQPMLQALQ